MSLKITNIEELEQLNKIQQSLEITLNDLDDE